MQPEFYRYNKPFLLESAEAIPELTIAYCTYGKINREKSNVV